MLTSVWVVWTDDYTICEDFGFFTSKEEADAWVSERNNSDHFGVKEVPSRALILKDREIELLERKLRDANEGLEETRRDLEIVEKSLNARPGAVDEPRRCQEKEKKNARPS